MVGAYFVRLSSVADRYGLPPYAATRFFTSIAGVFHPPACGSVLALKLGVANAIVRFSAFGQPT